MPEISSISIFWWFTAASCDQHELIRLKLIQMLRVLLRQGIVDVQLLFDVLGRALGKISSNDLRRTTSHLKILMLGLHPVVLIYPLHDDIHLDEYMECVDCYVHLHPYCYTMFFISLGTSINIIQYLLSILIFIQIQ